MGAALSAALAAFLATFTSFESSAAALGLVLPLVTTYMQVNESWNENISAGLQTIMDGSMNALTTNIAKFVSTTLNQIDLSISNENALKGNIGVLQAQDNVNMGSSTGLLDQILQTQTSFENSNVQDYSRTMGSGNAMEQAAVLKEAKMMSQSKTDMVNSFANRVLFEVNTDTIGALLANPVIVAEVEKTHANSICQKVANGQLFFYCQAQVYTRVGQDMMTQNFNNLKQNLSRYVGALTSQAGSTKNQYQSQQLNDEILLNNAYMDIVEIQAQSYQMRTQLILQYLNTEQERLRTRQLLNQRCVFQFNMAQTGCL